MIEVWVYLYGRPSSPPRLLGHFASWADFFAAVPRFVVPVDQYRWAINTVQRPHSGVQLHLR